ncbi:cysteine proteinase [Lophiostoma macrostomum CBS 122681]|uniref:Cysteine proteinase n=1 Tax=Lophiostoma macrostomum CBS 122681 TaxID=1314788 RepID=A0A6A6T354_9PLEO|nr:cysteine proteinase [Lophiostoma macrostomum CBS 122681]
MSEIESPDALQARHRKEQRDLVARITQKKKSATKKTRKGVNDECDRLEQELKERHAREASAHNEGAPETPTGELEVEDARDQEPPQTNGNDLAVDSLSISTTPNEPQPDHQGPKKKQNRAKARLARRAAEQDALAAQAAEEAANLPDQRELERIQMKDLFEKHGLQEKEIRADGHCLYVAVADQMETNGLGLKPRIQPTFNGETQALPPYKAVRHAAADFISQNSDDFVPFMEEPLDAYIQKIRETGEWGGHMELMALAKTYRVKINVLHADGRVDRIEPEEGSSSEDEKVIWLGYYKHNFGLGEHYNSLRKTP